MEDAQTWRRRRRTRLVPRAAQSQMGLVLLCLLLALWMTGAEQHQDVDDGNDDVYMQQDDDNNGRAIVYSEEETTSDDSSAAVMIAVFSFLCALAITFFSLLLAYFSKLEDALLRRYLKQGVTVRAQVVSSNLVRAAAAAGGIDDCRCGDNENSKPVVQEHVAMVDYLYQEDFTRTANDYQSSTNEQLQHVRIRKQVKFLNSDFVVVSPNNTPTGSAAEPPPPIAQVNVAAALQPPASAQQQDDPPAGPAPSFEFSVSSSRQQQTNEHEEDDLSHKVPPPRQVDLLILPGYRFSGFPKAQAQRMCQPQYRFITALIVASTLVLSIFCLMVSASFVASPEEVSHNITSDAATAGLVELAIFVVQWLAIHACLGSVIEKMVQEEYLYDNNGTLVEKGEDDSTISTIRDEEEDSAYMLL